MRAPIVRVLMLAAILYVAYTYAKVSGGTASFDYFELQRLQLQKEQLSQFLVHDLKKAG